jgi:hypothetical protein
MSARLQHACQRGHCGSTDADQVIVFHLTFKLECGCFFTQVQE